MTDDYEQEQQNQDVASEEYREPQPERPPGGEPVPADFEDYDLYVKAMIDYQVGKASEGFSTPST